MSTKSKIITAVVILFAIIVFWPRGESVEKYRDQLIAGVNQELAASDNPVRKKIEDAHVTATAKSARVTACSVRTVDGSDNAGKNGSNVAEIDLVITVIWDGWIQKDGFTEFEIDYDNQSKATKGAKYLRSSAMVNFDTVDWFQVGYTIGGYIAAASL